MRKTSQRGVLLLLVLSVVPACGSGGGGGGAGGGAPTLTSIGVTPATPQEAVGRNVAFTATGTYSDNSQQDITDQVNWDSSAPGVAVISNAVGTEGVASCDAVGAATGTNGSTQLTCTPPELVSITVTPVNPTIEIGQTQQFTAMGNYMDASILNLTAVITWDSATPAVATINVQGLATSATVGSTLITATEPVSTQAGTWMTCSFKNNRSSSATCSM